MCFRQYTTLRRLEELVRKINIRRFLMKNNIFIDFKCYIVIRKTLDLREVNDCVSNSFSNAVDISVIFRRIVT